MILEKTSYDFFLHSTLLDIDGICAMGLFNLMMFCLCAMARHCDIVLIVAVFFLVNALNLD